LGFARFGALRFRCFRGVWRFTWGTASGRALSASGGASGTHLSAGGYQAADWKPATGNQIMLYVGEYYLLLGLCRRGIPLYLEKKY
jgi:hypothetical protein